MDIPIEIHSGLFTCFDCGFKQKENPFVKEPEQPSEGQEELWEKLYDDWINGKDWRKEFAISRKGSGPSEA